MDSSIDSPAEYIAHIVIDGVSFSESTIEAPPLAAASAWQQALSDQLTTVITDWIARTSRPDGRH